MNFYSQKKYNDVLGSCRDTIKSSGCFLTSLCNLNLYLKFYKIVNPAELNDIFTTNNIWVQGCLISGPKIASFFNLEYSKKTSSDMLSICETDAYKKVGVPQHFFLYDPEKKERVDPLDLTPQWEPNTYNIVSYRIFKTMQPEVETMQTEPKLCNTIALDALHAPYSVFNDTPVPIPIPEEIDSPSPNFWITLWLKIKELLGL